MRSTKALALALSLLILGPNTFLYAVEIGRPIEPAQLPAEALPAGLNPGLALPTGAPASAAVPTLPSLPALPAPLPAAPVQADVDAALPAAAAAAEPAAAAPLAAPGLLSVQAGAQPVARAGRASAPAQALGAARPGIAAGRLAFDNQKASEGSADAAVPGDTGKTAPAPLPAASAAPQPAASASVPAPAAAAAPSRIASKIVIGPGTFQLADFPDLRDPVLQKRLQAARDAKDQDKASLILAAYMPISANTAKMAYSQRMKADDWIKMPPAERKARSEAFAQAMPQLLKQRLLDTLKANGATAETVDGDITVYTVTDGVKFWTDLVNAPTSDETLAALVYLSAFKAVPDRAARLVGLVHPSFELKTQLIDARSLSAEDLTAVGAAAQANGLQAARHGPYILVGGGISFFVANAIFDAADALKDPALAARFARVTRFVAAQSIPIAYSSMPGAVAFYTPMKDEMNYVLPASSSASLNATAHELNHARFSRFLNGLRLWVTRRNLAVPYEIDGPGALFSPFGAYMTLLNELNSWRIGQSFDGGMKDKDILKVLLQSYGGEAGWDNVQRFSKVWTVQAIRGKSVPRLILERIRALNALDAAGMETLGQNALAQQDVIAAQNFLRLAQLRYPEGRGLPAALSALAERLRSFPDAGVAQAARAYLPEAQAPAASAPAPAAPASAPQPAAAAKPFDADFVLRQLSRDSFLGMTDAKKVRTAKEFLLWKIVERALTLDDPSQPGRQAQALKLLSDLFDKWGFAPLYGERALASMNAMQQSMDRNAGRPPSPEVQNRAVQKDHVFFSPWLVGMMTETLFDGRPGNHRAAFVELLRSRIFPEEMAPLAKGLAYFLTKDVRTKQTLNELMVARMFLSAPALELFPTQRAWGDAAAEAMRQDPAQFPGMLESLAEYYRIGLGPALPGGSWGQYASTALDAAQRAKELAAVGETAQRPSDWSRYQKARDTLWAMLSHESPLVRTAARYALAGHPAYLLGLEPQLAQVLSGPASPLRLEAVALAAMTQPGFMPSVDAALARADFAATPDEARLLLPRRDQDARGVWKP